jgi:hypothetical protein
VGVQPSKGKTQIVVHYPVLEVESPEEAEALLAFTCSKNSDGLHIANEVELDRSNALLAFQRRLADAYAVMKRKPRRK